MTEKLQQIAKEEILKLPKETREAIASLDWVKISEEIGIKYLIDEVEINAFQTETLLVLLGLQDFDDYVRHIEDNVGTSKNQAKEIMQETLEKIFTPIGNKIEENIKNSSSVNHAWDKTVNFILSGGDYSSFLYKQDDNYSDGI